MRNPEQVRHPRTTPRERRPRRVFDEGTEEAEEELPWWSVHERRSTVRPRVPPWASGEAVEGGLLSDYKVLVLAVDEAAITRQFQELLTDEDGQLSIDDVARMVGCWKGLSTRGSKTGMRACERPDARWRSPPVSARSQRVADALERVSEQLTQDKPWDCCAPSVDGTMNVAQRGGKLQWRWKANLSKVRCILTNARCASLRGRLDDFPLPWTR